MRKRPRYLDLLDAPECSQKGDLIQVMMVETNFHGENSVLHDDNSLLQNLMDAGMFICKFSSDDGENRFSR